jgi:hypothetical protein
MLVLTAAILRVPRNNTSPFPNEKQVASYEAAESNVRCPSLRSKLSTNNWHSRENHCHSSFTLY